MVESRAQHIDPSHKATRSPWLNGKRLEFWLLWLPVMYAVFGFLVAPQLASKLIVSQFSEGFGLQARITDIDINPFTLSFSAEDFVLDDQNGQRLLAIEDLFVNYQLSSVFYRAHVAKNIRLSGASANFVRHAAADTNFSRAFQGTQTQPNPEADPNGEALPRIRIDKLEFKGGSLDFTDEIPETKFHTSINPINLSVENLNTLPGISGTQTVHVSTEHGGSLEWSGNIQFLPFKSTGHARLAGTHLELVRKYMQDQFEFELSDADTSIDFDYSITTGADQEPAISIEALNLLIRDLSLGAAESAINIPELRVSGGNFHWPEQTIQIQGVELSDAEIRVTRQSDGSIDLVNIFTIHDPPQGSAAPADHDSPWNIVIDQLGVSGMGISLLDQTTAQPASLFISNLGVTLEQFSNIDGPMSPIAVDLNLDSGGHISANGHIGLFPELLLESSLDITGMSLLPAQPYISEIAGLGMQSGEVSLSATVSVSADNPFEFNGQLAVTDLELTDSARDQRFAGWQSFNIDKLLLKTGERILEISEVKLLNPYARVEIAADQSTNVGRIFALPDSPAEPEALHGDTLQPEPYTVTLGHISVENGSANFSDESLPIKFATAIQQLNGDISTFVSGSSEPALVSMEGQVDEYGLARIEGAINLVAPAEQMDMEIIFDNLELQALSPYTIAFAGRRIDEGKLDLELDYQLKNQKMKGENNIVLKDIKLGEKVDHPGAMALPLDLAVALLKGANGEIDINLPVSGNLDDPEFSYGGIVVKALAGLIVKAVASPFRLLGRLLGGDSEDFGKIGFLPGRATLSPPELEKAHQLAEVLKMRPQLNVLAGGVIDPVADKLALQADMLETLLNQALAAADAPGAGAMLLDQTRLAVEKMYTALPEHTPPAQLQQQFSTAGEAGGAPVLDQLAYVAEMKSQLVRVQPVTAQDLEMLASKRANAIIEAIREKLPVGIERVSTGASSEVKAGDGDWITAELELAAKPAK